MLRDCSLAHIDLPYQVIIIGRRLEVLETAQKRLLDFAKAEGLKTDVIARACDLTISSQVAELWGTLASEGVVVDVLISNAASFPEPKPLLDLGAEQTWAHVETNAKAPLFFAEKFVQQLGEKKGVSYLFPRTEPISGPARHSHKVLTLEIASDGNILAC